jgi:hypothetical protein
MNRRRTVILFSAREHVINWERGSPNRFGEPLPRTTLRYGRNGLNGQCHQVLPGLSVFRAYDACYFVTQVPKKVVL